MVNQRIKTSDRVKVESPKCETITEKFKRLKVMIGSISALVVAIGGIATGTISFDDRYVSSEVGDSHADKKQVEMLVMRVDKNDYEWKLSNSDSKMYNLNRDLYNVKKDLSSDPGNKFLQNYKNEIELKLQEEEKKYNRLLMEFEYHQEQMEKAK